MKTPIRNIVIAGGGTAGWMTAAAFSKLLGKKFNITLVESDEIGTIGVGEATIPTLHIFHRLLGIDEQDFMKSTHATFKLGISFEGWLNGSDQYLHSFGFLGQDCWACDFHHFWKKGLGLGIEQAIGDYCAEHLAAREGRFSVNSQSDQNHAYHLDASLYAQFLRDLSERHGVTRREGKINEVVLCPTTGEISSLKLESGESIEGDFFIDCTGFKALLLRKALHVGFENWSDFLPCDRAIAVQSNLLNEPVPFTRAIAHPFGWQWQIPLQSRVGNGIVFCSQHISEDEAASVLRENIVGEPITEPNRIFFQTGLSKKHWQKNCAAVGLSGGFIEPLESTAIHLIQRSIIHLLQLIPRDKTMSSLSREFNTRIRREMEDVRDFIILHYKSTAREDSAFWRYCKSMDAPQSLTDKVNLFRESGMIFKKEEELFAVASWVQVLLGQGHRPSSYHPIVDLMTENELRSFLEKQRTRVSEKVKSWPNVNDFIKNYCC